MQKKVVITGGPGTGKTTIINELIHRKYNCMQEISRQLTLDARAKGIEQLFVSDPLLFSNLLVKGRIEQYKEVEKSKNQLTFFDRGIPDVHAYMDCIGINYPSTFVENCKKYQYTHIFITPPWESIYSKDNERYETFEESIKIFSFLKNAYQKLNYTIVEVPFGTVTERTDFILDSLKNA